ncbi:alpha/beta fold hydrolase [Govanella unica]|uniref:Alpha/beta hydrolase n=1 Tax=Govanella unica TaxID=2975056 RepID=A0A9X3TZJ1_9PROT|nr:alpha/beta hydrolase [Govania unica]MDA5194841.1 alpha/beta hydrolase [Govania unica]
MTRAEPATPEIGFLSLPAASGHDGLTIEYLRFGQAEAKDMDKGDDASPVIVLLHEGLGSVSQWGGFTAALAARTGLAVFAYSRPGYGSSGPVAGDYAPDYMSSEATQILPAVLAAARIDRPVLFGHSDGATVALLYAAAFPDRARAVIVEAPHVFVEDISVKAIARIGAAARETALIERLGRHHDDPEGVFWRWNRIWLSPAFRPWDITAELCSLRAPLLLIQGEDDEYGTLAQIDAIAASVAGPVTRLMLPDCGHSPHRDQPSAVLAASAAFLGSDKT